MKKFSLLVCMAYIALAQVVVAAVPASPLVVTKTTSTVTIDGAGAEAAWSAAAWSDIAVVFKGEIAGFTNAADFAGKFKVIYDVNKVYFFFDITDDIITQDPARHWAGDKVEIYFGLAGYSPTAGANAALSRQFAFKAQIDPTAKGEEGSNNYPPASDALATNGVTYAYVEGAAGYTLEVSIDRAIALEGMPDNTPVAFDVCVADNDEVGAAAIRYRKSWYNDGEVNELWSTMIGAGQLKLQGFDGLTSTAATAAPTIDAAGTDAVWTAAPWNNIAVVFKAEAAGFTSAADFTGKFKVADDANKVYFLFDISDDIITQDPARHWAGDKVEIYFGLPGYDPTAGANASHSRQFAFKAQIDPTVQGENGSNNYAPASNALGTNGVTYAYVEGVAGYMLEVAIDKAIALESAPNNTTLGFDVCVADNDEVGAAAKRYRKSWFNDGAVNELWGSMAGAGKIQFSTYAPAAVNQVLEAKNKIYTSGKSIVVENVKSEVSLFDLSGRCIQSNKLIGTFTSKALNTGMYIIRVDGATRKVAVQ